MSEHDSRAPSTAGRIRRRRASLRRFTHKTIERVTKDLNDFQFNTMVAALIEFTNELMRAEDTDLPHTPEWREAMRTLVLLMAPSAPPTWRKRLWERLGDAYSVHSSHGRCWMKRWPWIDVVEIVVQVNGKVRDEIMIARAEWLCRAASRL